MRNVIVVLTIFICGCTAIDKKVPSREKFSFEMKHQTNIFPISEREQINISLLGFNQRYWRDSELSDFDIPSKWLRGGNLSDHVYVVKQIGSSSIFCWIKPDESNKRPTEYIIFLVKRDDSEPNVMPEFWESPVKQISLRGENYQLIQIYKGVSRSYAERLMNKFPWRSFVRE